MFVIDSFDEPSNNKKVLSQKDNLLKGSGISWSSDGISLNPNSNFSDAGELGITINGAERATINTLITDIKSDFSNIFFNGTHSVNSLGATTPSSAITPTKTFTPKRIKYMALLSFAQEIDEIVKEFEEEDYGSNVKYTYEFVDYDEFSPS